MKTTEGMRIATVWKLCLEMWNWIASQIEDGDRDSVALLKRKWCKKHNFFFGSDCFFCDWASRHKHNALACSCCPGKAIAPRFDCVNSTYDYYTKPLKFHAKLHRMNKKRLKVNREKK